ncbi:hypothetical protein V6O07_01030 [Arthrospira platensis SPKY2]
MKDLIIENGDIQFDTKPHNNVIITDQRYHLNYDEETREYNLEPSRDPFPEEQNFNNETQYKDIMVYEGNEVKNKVFIRLLLTPLGHLKLRVLQSTGSTFIDYDIGNGIYGELSQPLNINLINRSNAHIHHAIKYRPKGVKINYINTLVSSFDTVKIFIHYSINNKKYKFTKELNSSDL